MSRTKGLIPFSGNFEPQVASPLDARSIVGTKADLTDAAIWVANNGGTYTYNGMLVTVMNDGVNNGTYCLNGAITNPASWTKIGDSVDLSDYVKFGTSTNKNTKSDLYFANSFNVEATNTISLTGENIGICGLDGNVRLVADREISISGDSIQLASFGSAIDIAASSVLVNNKFVLTEDNLDVINSKFNSVGISLLGKVDISKVTEGGLDSSNIPFGPTQSVIDNLGHTISCGVLGDGIMNGLILGSRENTAITSDNLLGVRLGSIVESGSNIYSIGLETNPDLTNLQLFSGIQRQDGPTVYVKGLLSTANSTALVHDNTQLTLDTTSAKINNSKILTENDSVVKLKLTSYNSPVSNSNIQLSYESDLNIITINSTGNISFQWNSVCDFPTTNKIITVILENKSGIELNITIPTTGNITMGDGTVYKPINNTFATTLPIQNNKIVELSFLFVKTSLPATPNVFNVQIAAITQY